MSRRLVIDASIGKSAGTSENPVSAYCREFLTGVSDVPHVVVMTAELQREWIKHQSLFALSWLGVMVRRGKVVFLEDVNSLWPAVEQAVEFLHDEDPQTARIWRAELEKDIHLVDAALATDRILASRDERLRKLLSSICGQCQTIQKVMWVNPVLNRPTAMVWLKAGARSDPTCMIKP